MARRLPRDMILLAVSDPRDTLPAFVENLPVLVQQMNLMFPAVGAAREAARRAQCTNNLKQIGLAMHNYVAAHNNAFPAPALPGKDGKPALSWRVALLPYLEQQSLYDRFHLDEPWDSPHNKALIKEMPAVFTCPEPGRRRAGDDDLPRLHGAWGALRGRPQKGLAGRHRRDSRTRSWPSRPGRRCPGPGPTPTSPSTRRRPRRSTAPGRRTRGDSRP